MNNTPTLSDAEAFCAEEAKRVHALFGWCPRALKYQAAADWLKEFRAIYPHLALASIEACDHHEHRLGVAIRLKDA